MWKIQSTVDLPENSLKYDQSIYHLCCIFIFEGNTCFKYLLSFIYWFTAAQNLCVKIIVTDYIRHLGIVSTQHFAQES